MGERTAPRIDLLISNDRHHLEMVRPVAERLAAGPAACSCRVLSLCELRGLRSPAAAFRGSPVKLVPVLPLKPRRSPSTWRLKHGEAARRRRNLLRWLLWRLALAPRLGALLRDRPDLVVTPNDAAFPYDRLVALLRRRGLPYLLLQEGIRFPLPGSAGDPVYGAGGAAAVAAWGETSADYFRSVGVPAERIHRTGSPRFDRLDGADAGEGARRAAERWGLGETTLLLLTNPIDDQGFCSGDEKLALVQRFARGIAPLFRRPGFHLAVKLHGRESRSLYARALAEVPAERLTLLEDVPLSVLFDAAAAVVVFASTAGLEALARSLPLGVLEIPGFGFQYDYVQSGAALGLTWREPLEPQVAALLAPSPERDAAAREYLGRQITGVGGATDRVARLILELSRSGKTG